MMSENTEFHAGKELRKIYLEAYETASGIRDLIFGNPVSLQESSKTRYQNRRESRRAQPTDIIRLYRERRENRNRNKKNLVVGRHGKSSFDRGLLPILRSGKRIVFLARDCTLLAEIFDCSVAWGLNRSSKNESHFKELVKEQIKNGDIIIDTGWRGSIPEAISKYRDIKTMLLSGDSASFADIVLSNYADQNGQSIREHLVSFEHSPKLQENDDNGFTFSTLDKDARKRAQAYRLGFIAGLWGLNRIYEIENAKKKKREQFRKESQKRMQIDRSVRRGLELLDLYVQYSRRYTISEEYDYERGTHQWKARSLTHSEMWDIKYGYKIRRSFSKYEYADRWAEAKNLRGEIWKGMSQLVAWEDRIREQQLQERIAYLKSIAVAQSINW